MVELIETTIYSAVVICTTRVHKLNNHCEANLLDSSPSLHEILRCKDKICDTGFERVSKELCSEGVVPPPSMWLSQQVFCSVTPQKFTNERRK